MSAWPAPNPDDRMILVATTDERLVEHLIFVRPEDWAAEWDDGSWLNRRGR